MSLVAVAADKGALGVTTTALALALTWPRPVCCWPSATRPARTCPGG